MRPFCTAVAAMNAFIARERRPLARSARDPLQAFAVQPQLETSFGVAWRRSRAERRPLCLAGDSTGFAALCRAALTLFPRGDEGPIIFDWRGSATMCPDYGGGGAVAKSRERVFLYWPRQQRQARTAPQQAPPPRRSQKVRLGKRAVTT